ncbi:MAG: GLPGLI family protein [Muribaculaceae bacterium]|nr:GLPGLI family protein [Muribaculaceae bacterium]
MKKITLIIMLGLLSAGAFCQQKADIVLSYEKKSRNWVTDSLQKSNMTLLVNSGEAKYFNDVSLWTDSLKSTPEGKKQWQEIIMATCMTKDAGGGMSIDLRKGPVKKIHDYIFTRVSDGSLRHYTKLGDENIYYDEPLSEMQWEIGDSTVNILGYDCVSAVTDYHGRRWMAWFATDIPVSFGPWKLHGLPGLILKAESDNGCTFRATGIEKTDRIISPMYSPDAYDRKDRKKALADEEHYLNNKEAIIKSKYANVEFQGRREPKKYDCSRYSLEPDYKE